MSVIELEQGLVLFTLTVDVRRDVDGKSVPEEWCTEFTNQQDAKVIAAGSGGLPYAKAMLEFLFPDIPANGLPAEQVSFYLDPVNFRGIFTGIARMTQIPTDQNGKMNGLTFANQFFALLDEAHPHEINRQMTYILVSLDDLKAPEGALDVIGNGSSGAN